MHFFRCKGLADPNINVVLNSKALLVSMNAILVEDITVTSDEKVFIHQVKKDIESAEQVIINEIKEDER